MNETAKTPTDLLSGINFQNDVAGTFLLDLKNIFWEVLSHVFSDLDLQSSYVLKKCGNQ